jgi:hypothetical protein
MSDLIVIEPESALSVFTEQGKLDPILDRIASEVRTFVPDITSAKGRKDIASLAYRVAQSKTYLDNLGKDLVAEYKELPKRIDANRKQMRDFLDALKDEARAPLDAWEAEQAKIEAEQKAAIEAEALRLKVESDHEIALLMNSAFDAEQAERLRIAEQERADREREIARIAAEQERERAEKQIIEARMAQERAEKAQAEAEQAAAKAASDALEAERMRRDAEAERERQEQASREADLEHRRVINRAAFEAIKALGVAESQATAIVSAIARGEIPNVCIKY